MSKKTLKEELAILDNYPYGTKEHKATLKRIQKEFNKKYSGNYILCTHGKFNSGCFGQSVPTNDGVFNSDIIGDVLSSPTFMAEDFYFHDRMYCEHNLEHRQIIVNTLVLNKARTHAIVLQEDAGKVSLIGGHVDFSPKDYHRSLEETLYANMIKETNEESGNATYITAFMPELPTHIVSCNGSKSNFYDNMHVFFMYVFELDDEHFDKQVKIMKRNERGHRPVKMSLEDAYKRTSKNSIKKIIEHVQKGKKNTDKEVYPEGVEKRIYDGALREVAALSEK